MITRFDGDLAKLSYLRNDVVNSAYLVQPPTDVAIVGVGGGRDILAGLLFGAKHIRGIEINPAIFEVLTDKFAAFSGHLDRQPGVNLVNAEARSYINHSSERYDLVQISLIDTWAATAAGGLTLTENRLYTVDAWSDFYRALKPGGLLSVSRWFGLDAYRGEFHRLIAIAVKALERQGVPSSELARHVIALNVGNIVTVITRPDAFTAAQWTGARERLQAQGFKILLGPGVAFDDITSTLMSGKADPAYLASLPSNITASTDDNPFFFFTQRFSQLLAHPWAAITENNAPVSMTLLLLLVALGACVYYIAVPFVRLAQRMPLMELTPPVAYFSAIGMGFMLIEISQMQRLMVFLGHPVYGLGVVLFTILICSGIGSMTVGALAPRPGAVFGRLAALLATLVLTGVLTPLVTTWTRSEATDIRILVSALLLAPPAFCMGMMFPLGLNIWRRHADLLPFFWSANGITSMLASVLGMALSIAFGIANTYAIGVGFYVVSGAMLILGRQANPMGAATTMMVSDLDLVRQGVGALDPVAPSIQATEVELLGGTTAAAALEPTPS